MKTKLILLTIAAAAFAVSADSHAMMRRASVRKTAQKVSMPKPQKVTQRIQPKDVPQIAPEKLQNGPLHPRYQELLVKKEKCTRELTDRAVKSGLEIKEMAKITLPTVYAVGSAIGSMEFLTIGMPFACIFSAAFGVAHAHSAGFFDVLKERSRVDKELAALVRDQEYQLTNPEDKQ